MKKYFFIILLFIICISCDSQSEITYSYNGVSIKRIDKYGKTTFYYNEIQNNAPKIWVEYSGINDGFSGYLLFSKNKKVYLLSGDGYFQSKNIDISKFEYKEIGAYERPMLSDSVYIIKDAIRYEKEFNNSFHTKVKVNYGNAPQW